MGDGDDSAVAEDGGAQGSLQEGIGLNVYCGLENEEGVRISLRGSSGWGNGRKQELIRTAR